MTTKMMKLFSGICIVALCAGLTGCVTTPKPKGEQSAVAPPSQQPASSSDYWAKREKEDKIARNNAQSRGVPW